MDSFGYEPSQTVPMTSATFTMLTALVFLAIFLIFNKKDNDPRI